MTEINEANSISSLNAALIVNADDWGRDRATTDRMLDCALKDAISSVSAMVFMADSGRAAELAREHSVDTGLHLNLIEPFIAPEAPARLKTEQEKLVRFLRRHRYARTVFHPGLIGAFDYVAKTQIAEYAKLYGVPPRRVDGHEHMHLCANVIAQGLLPAGAIVRRNFTFEAGEKSFINRMIRGWQDRQLARRHPMTDYFFDLIPLEPQRLARIGELARHANVEVEAHVIHDEQYRFLMDGGLARAMGGATAVRGYVLRARRDAA